VTRLTPESSSIASIKYGEVNETLLVKFKNGKTYKYCPVPPDEAKALFDAESVGSYFSSVIRKDYVGVLVP